MAGENISFILEIHFQPWNTQLPEMKIIFLLPTTKHPLPHARRNLVYSVFLSHQLHSSWLGIYNTYTVTRTQNKQFVASLDVGIACKMWELEEKQCISLDFVSHCPKCNHENLGVISFKMESKRYWDDIRGHVPGFDFVKMHEIIMKCMF